MMGMPITVEIADVGAKAESIDKVFDYFTYIDKKFSVYKENSEISQINRGEIKEEDYSVDMKEIFKLAEKTKKESQGYFDISRNGRIDPSGIVKGWAIYKAAELLEQAGYHKFFVDAGGDIQVKGSWTVGIRNPFNRHENVKIVRVNNKGVATSGTYIRGQHIYNPFIPDKPISEIISLTVIGPNIYEADRFATPAFAMGKKGILFIDNFKGLEGYMIDTKGIATFTSGWGKYDR